MNILYKNTKLEHETNEIKAKYVFVSSEDIDLECEMKKAQPENFEAVVRFYKEENKTVIVCVTAETYAERVQIAQSAKAGILFVNESIPEESVCLASLSGYSNYELEKFAAEIGAQIDIKRFVMSVAREVPFSLSKADAEKIITDAAGYELNEAIDLFEKMLANDEINFQRLKQVASSDQIITSRLSANRPGSEATIELLAYADKIYEEGGIHILEAGLGFGKTQHAIRPIMLKAKAESKKSTLLTHRVAISSSFDDICDNYSDTKIAGNEDKLDSLSLVVNSANQQRFKLHTEQSDILIIDEGSQVIAHILQKGFKGDRLGVFHELLKLIKGARLVLIADAFISNILMKFVALAGRKINFTKGFVDNSGNEIALAEIHTAQRMIMDDVAVGKKPMVGLDSRKEAEALASYITKQEKKVLLVTQKTRGYPEVEDFFKKPNSEIKKYDALVYSPSMQSSISIVEKHFDTHYCLFFGVIGIDDAKQFTRRDRTNNKVVVGVSRQVRIQLDKESLINELFASDDYLFDSIALPFYKNDAKEKNNFRTNLALSLNFDGYKVTRIEPSAADEIAFTTFQSEKRAVKEYVVQSTVAAAKEIVNTANFESYFEGKNENQRFHNDALSAAEMLGKRVADLDEDDIAFYKEGSGAAKFMNARCCLLSDLDFRMFAEYAENERGRDYRSLAGRRAFYTRFMDALGVVNGDEILTDMAMKQAAELAVRNKHPLIGYGILTKNAKCKTANEINATINAVLKSVGLSKARIRNEGAWAYKLSEPAFLRIISYIDRRRYKELVNGKKQVKAFNDLQTLIINENALKRLKEKEEESTITNN
ncbi:hypothetical protein HBN74_01730 [Pseudomonas sp. WS 5019]|nr:hypothetical protein [Pseudomonas sp. WS 5019]NMY14279.1 hypothetical protein [Pseudomonas sp. WS 5019]